MLDTSYSLYTPLFIFCTFYFDFDLIRQFPQLGPKVPSQTVMDMHDMHGMTMSTATSTTSAAMASSTGMDMGGMDHGGMHMGNSCKISMLWNWNTVDACFLAKSWHIKSRGMFAGSCIGVICLVLSLELLRRLGRVYDSFIVRRARLRRLYIQEGMLAPYRPSLVEHSVRSLLHMVQFAVAYIIMLLAMYFNGYIIICIFIGAFLGAFIFSWEPVDLNKESDATSVTKCCG
ncbi:Pc18g05180 [Penicillium rubens Wisconsin 54-1255]|uniref:Copper transport protein n=1 Tax=Penicillium rubens (strain ATCC 28089 / DSM 1075 / NRRL 1951 / Wisconsin 54-1255) TaxID=500485 RepID=B6HC10_PENRW|nr:Pc18g05180 [Penicillium rubens Wisconsin 54-1255]